MSLSIHNKMYTTRISHKVHNLSSANLLTKLSLTLSFCFLNSVIQRIFQDFRVFFFPPHVPHVCLLVCFTPIIIWSQFLYLGPVHTTFLEAGNIFIRVLRDRNQIALIYEQLMHIFKNNMRKRICF